MDVGKRPVKRAAHGYEPTREATMAAFAKSWHRGTRNPNLVSRNRPLREKNREAQRAEGTLDLAKTLCLTPCSCKGGIQWLTG
jgi:hypothetical protein